MAHALSNTAVKIVPARSAQDIAAAVRLGWAFFDMLREFPEVAADVEKYLREHKVAKKFEAFAEHFLPPAGDCLLAKNGNLAVGTVMFVHRSDTRAEMTRMFLDPSARGTGAGRLLCLGIIDAARNAGYAEITLDTLRVLEPAIALYRSVGFVDDDRPGTYGADDPNVVNMRLDL